MLIKITRGLDHPRNFTLYDNAASVECLCPIHFDDSEGLYRWMFDTALGADEIHHLVHQDLRKGFEPFSAQTVAENFPLSPRRRYSVSAVAFNRFGKRYVVFFDGEAYVCTDEGKTLERIIAGGIYTDEPVAA